MILVNATKKTTVCDRCHFANSLLKRMVGLLNRKGLASGEGLLLDRCYGIHTVGMRFPIDVLFLDKELHVMRAVEALPPFRTCIVKQAIYVLELPIGAIRGSRTEAGDQIQMRTAGAETAASPKNPASEKIQAGTQ
ncbi:MAG TPA: DUF192 domain-containing protein [Verrucomicrobiae bacterium]|nr:DUF192 domain-containing protein [Verrucomicrobiae bacterium]